ncbi:hypothetical protein DMA11_10370 [Marinilabiliaceae bacterium JC017]|nr:hypothetical protein DMA11_10370 [Marinilabiliaceae bacterium JC017]
MYRFLLAENPMREGRVFILHTVAPKCLIEVAEPQSDPVSSGYPHQVFSYTNIDGVKETWALIVRDVYDQPDIIDVGKLLQRAWKWYRAYLENEDKNIDEDRRNEYYGTVN